MCVRVCVCVCACVCISRVFRLSNPSGCVFMRSQANCVIKVLINVTVCIKLCVSREKRGKQEKGGKCVCV